MTPIVFATDYSPIAQNAVIYAAELAKYLEVELEIIHAYVIPFAYTDSPVPLLNVEEIQNIAETSMQAELKRVQAAFPTLKITSRILPGEIIDCLVEVVEAKSPLMIVMGTSGTGSGSFLWGSAAVKALRTLTIPVLAVASDIIWKPIRNICFAADYEQISESTPFEKVIDWVERLKARLFIVHVENQNSITEIPALLEQKLQALQPTYHSIVNENMVEGINEYIQEKQVDWLVVVPKKYGFLENLFHKSRTKILAQGSNVPVLAFHHD